MPARTHYANTCSLPVGVLIGTTSLKSCFSESIKAEHMGWEMAQWAEYSWHKREFIFTEPTSMLGRHGGPPVIPALRIPRWGPLNKLPR